MKESEEALAMKSSYFHAGMHILAEDYARNYAGIKLCYLSNFENDVIFIYAFSHHY